MLSLSPFPDPSSSLYPSYNTISTPTPYQHPVTPHLLSSSTYSGLPMDPAATDFRAFYPYTPNEVKHRKRTTSTQLKTLETVFRRDTKPNGPLRVELATKLGMTPRGVQVRLFRYIFFSLSTTNLASKVWFQNRYASPSWFFSSSITILLPQTG
jgi:Homeodomain